MTHPQKKRKAKKEPLVEDTPSDPTPESLDVGEITTTTTTPLTDDPFTDFSIIYVDTTTKHQTIFRTHKATLFNHSKYFQTVLMCNPPIHELYLPQAPCVKVDDVHAWLKLMYPSEESATEITLRSRCSKIMHLSHYFQCEQLEQLLKKFMTNQKDLIGIRMHGTAEDASYVSHLGMLVNLDRYHYTDVRRVYMNRLVQNACKRLRAEAKQASFTTRWDMLEKATQHELIRMLINNRLID